MRPGFLPPRAPGGGPPPRFEAPPAPPAAPAPAAEPPAFSAPAHEPTPYGRPLEQRPAARDRPVFVSPPRGETGPSSQVAVTGIVLGALSVLLLLMTLGLGYPVCGFLSLGGLLLGMSARRRIRATGTGRPGQAKAAVIVGSIGLGLAVVAAIVWAGLDASGFQPEDLQEWLEDRLREQRTAPPSPDPAPGGDSIS